MNTVKISVMVADILKSLVLGKRHHCPGSEVTEGSGRGWTERRGKKTGRKQTTHATGLDMGLDKTQFFLSQMFGILASLFNHPILVLPESQRPSKNLLKSKSMTKKKIISRRVRAHFCPASWSVLGRVWLPAIVPRSVCAP